MNARGRHDTGGTTLGRWFFLTAVPVAAVLWAVIALLSFIELSDLVRGAETEHSPVLVIGVLIVPTALLTWAALAARRR